MFSNVIPELTEYLPEVSRTSLSFFMTAVLTSLSFRALSSVTLSWFLKSCHFSLCYRVAWVVDAAGWAACAGAFEVVNISNSGAV